jgi:capsular polysaccharide transport system permease protein
MTPHLRIVSAFVIREIATRYGKSPGGYLWALLEPVAFIGMMSVLAGAIGRTPAMGESFPLFYATGFIAFNMYKGMESYLSTAISANRNLLSYPNVAPIDPIVARFTLQSLTSVIVALVVLSGALLSVRPVPQIHWSYIFEAIAFAWCMAAGMSLINIVLFFRFPLYEKAFAILTRPLFLLSGVLYVPADMPPALSGYLFHNQLVHVVILFREGFYGERIGSGLDRWFLAETSIILLFMGLALFTFWPVARAR